MNRRIVITGILSVGMLSACPDPAKDAPKAKVKEVTKAAAPASQPAKAAPAKPAAAMQTLKLDPASSKIEFVGSKVTGKHEGGFKGVTGVIQLAADNLTTSMVHVEIDTTSIYSDVEKLTGHLKSPDFFDVANHPKAVFDITSIKEGGEGDATHTLTGKLMMRGQTKSISFPATINVAADAVTAKAEFSINRKDFNMVYPGKPDDLIRDNVLVKLDVKAPRS